jgi:hypothetical protein
LGEDLAHENEKKKCTAKAATRHKGKTLNLPSLTMPINRSTLWVKMWHARANKSALRKRQHNNKPQTGLQVYVMRNILEKTMWQLQRKRTLTTMDSFTFKTKGTNARCESSDANNNKPNRENDYVTYV